MRFSIIVAFDNEFELINNFLENLLKTTDYSNGEIIMVSDGCTSINSLSYIKAKEKEYNFIHLVELPFQHGYSHANNIGVKNSVGEILVFMNSDVFPKKYSVNDLVNFVYNSPSIGAAQGLLIYPQNETVQSTGHLFSSYYNNHIYTGSEINSIVLTSGARQALTTAFCAVKRNIFIQNGLFDEIYYNAYEGMEMTFKITCSGYKCYYYHKAAAYHLVGGSRTNIGFDNATPGHIFWERWNSKIKKDIDVYIKPQLTEEILNNEYLIIQGSPIVYWQEVLESINIKWNGIIPIRERFSKTINLYTNLPISSLDYPSPYLFLVDSINNIKGNKNWFANRNNFKDLVLDGHALIKQTSEIY